MAFVLDASISLAWVLPGQATPRAEAVLLGVMRDYAIVPSIWHFEVASVLARDVRVGILNSKALSEFLALIFTLDIRLEQDVTPLPQLIDFALTSNLTAYDAAYLALAQARGIPLATNDAALARAANAAGVKTFKF